jgi:uncharacterized protein
MRISNGIAIAAVFGLAFGLGPTPTLSLDGTPSEPAARVSAVDAFRNATEALRSGEKKRALSALQYAAEQGHGFALWQLGKMYDEGDGVPRDRYRAFEYLQRFADSHADVPPSIPRSRFVADAFVSLGQYYLAGIPDSPVSPSPERARRMFYHAASYFGDPEAQYRLAMLYVDGAGVSRDIKRAVPWLVLAANKGHYRSQALLGRILFKGEHGLRQPATGLMWLTIACDGPGGSVPEISALRESAFSEATDRERQLALVMLERWVEGRR